MKQTGRIATALLMILIMLFSCTSEKENPAVVYNIVNQAASDSSSPFYIDSNVLSGNRNILPIGIFDSGTGGLAVLEAILTLDEFNNSTHQPGSDSIPDFISESFIYLADEANMPYGKYNSENSADFLRELVIKDVLFLLGNSYFLNPQDRKPKTDKKPVKEIVIACNTATAYGLESAKSAISEWALPVKITGIIEAGAASALKYLKESDSKNPLIAILATEGTCASGGYPNTILSMSGSLLKGKDIKVTQQAGIGLAGAIDGDLNYIDPDAVSARGHDKYFGPGLDNPDYPLNPDLLHDYNFNHGSELLIETNSLGDTVTIQLNSISNYVKYMITQLVTETFDNFPGRKIDVIILGCTHYPYVISEITGHLNYLRSRKRAYYEIIPERPVLIDPSRSLATQLYLSLHQNNLLGENSMSESQFYISVPNTSLKENIIDENNEFTYSWKYGREINSSLRYVKIVPFSERWIDPEIRKRIEETLPITNTLIK